MPPTLAPEGIAYPRVAFEHLLLSNGRDARGIVNACLHLTHPQAVSLVACVSDENVPTRGLENSKRSRPSGKTTP